MNALLILTLLFAAQEAKSGTCLKCHGEDVDRARHRESVHALRGLQCSSCHTGIDLETHADEPKVAKVNCSRCHETIPSDVHEGSCAECHNEPHYRSTASCTKCHGEIVGLYEKSVHGRAGHEDVPVCANCHMPHKMRSVKSPEMRLQSIDLCERCHGDAEKMSKHGVSTDVMQTYLSDFHGASVRLHRIEGGPSGPMKATCIDCHGAHDIRDKAALRSNLVTACAKCHPDANDSFTGAWLGHKRPGPKQSTLVFLVQLAYWIGIPFMLVGLGVFIVLDLRRTAPHPTGGPMVKRFNLWRRAEHLFVVVTFFLLIVTGLPQKFHDTVWGTWIIVTFGGLEILRTVHRINGFALAGLGIVHLAVNVIGYLRGRIRGDMLVRPRDFADTIEMVRHFVNPANPKPKLDRYDFRQKFEYWGMLLGSAVMITTGLVLIWPTLFAKVLPGFLIPVARTAHSFEAVLALLVIVVWHFYCIRTRANLFKIDTSIFTGKISLNQLREEHPGEYERLSP